LSESADEFVKGRESKEGGKAKRLSLFFISALDGAGRMRRKLYLGTLSGLEGRRLKKGTWVKEKERG